MEIELLERQSSELRKDIVEVCYHSKAGHVGGSLSAIDILNVLYFNELRIDPNNPKMENRDRFILSKGHIAEALYVTLAKRGGHPNNKVAGVEMNTGALGHGLAIGVGLAIAAKKMGQDYRTYVLMGDGELAEGSIWESAMAAGHYKLDNLCAIVDRNHLQISGCTETVMTLEDLKGKWQMFGFEVIEIDGNNYEEIINAFTQAKAIKNKPSLILANTVKGKGVSFMENQASWHHGVLDAVQYKQALMELGDL